MFVAIMQCSKRMSENRITESELASIQFLFLLKTAIRLHPHPEKYQKMLNQFFRSLSKHIEENYENVAVRIANVVLAMQELQVIKELKIICQFIFENPLPLSLLPHFSLKIR
jgi:hypothetical protein